MKIIGIGTDIIEIDRIEKALNLIKKRVFTKKEIEQIELKGQNIQSYAGRFSAKEAISKAFGTGIREFNLLDIEIINNSIGKPEVFFYGILKKKMKKDRLQVELSISHCKNYATAFAIVIQLEEI